MSKLSILEESGILPQKGEQPRNHPIGTSAEPSYEYGQYADFYDDTDLETVSSLGALQSSQMVQDSSGSPQVVISPLQYFSRVKPQSIVPVTRTAHITWTGVNVFGSGQAVWTVPSRQYCLITSIRTELLYAPDPIQQFNKEILPSCEYFRFDLTTTSTKFVNSSDVTLFGERSGFTGLNRNILDFGGLNASLLFKERDPLILTVDVPGSSSNYLPSGAFPGVSIVTTIDGFVLSSEDYTTMIQMGRRPSALNLEPSALPKKGPLRFIPPPKANRKGLGIKKL